MQAAHRMATDADLFQVLGLPRRLAVDRGDLDRRYHDASRVVHPDRHGTADPRTRDLSLAASAAVNRAYRTLRDPVERGRYWLELHGEPLGRDNNQVLSFRSLSEYTQGAPPTEEAPRTIGASR